MPEINLEFFEILEKFCGIHLEFLRTSCEIHWAFEIIELRLKFFEMITELVEVLANLFEIIVIFENILKLL